MTSGRMIMERNGFVLHGTVIYSDTPEKLITYDSAYVVCVDGISRGVFEELPEEYRDLPCEDMEDRLILPGLVDLHTHAPQYQFRATGMDLDLIDWLNTMAIPEEMEYEDLEYAERAYDLFVEELYIGPTTRACVFATKHAEATIGLMDMLEETGLVTYVGKVNMDRNIAEGYIETTEESLDETQMWLDDIRGRYSRTYPIITPRFTPACSRELMMGLAEIAREEHIPVQSHMSENLREMEWVMELEPDCRFYGETYDVCGLFGGPVPTVMAHCVWSSDEEISLMKEKGVYIAHCPESNFNIMSGLAPVRRYLDEGLHVGLGSDVAAGTTTLLFRAMQNAIITSKMRYTMVERSLKPLTYPEVFYMATKGGGSFFGKVGSFEEGYEFDAVVIDDRAFDSMIEMSAEERAEKLIYLADDRHVVGKYVRGVKLY